MIDGVPVRIIRNVTRTRFIATASDKGCLSLEAAIQDTRRTLHLYQLDCNAMRPADSQIYETPRGDSVKEGVDAATESGHLAWFNSCTIIIRKAAWMLQPLGDGQAIAWTENRGEMKSGGGVALLTPLMVQQRVLQLKLRFQSAQSSFEQRLPFSNSH